LDAAIDQEKSMLKSTMLLVSAAGILIGSIWAGSQEEIPRQERIERKDYMRAKLTFAQAIVEGLSIKNFDMLNTAATEIRNITEGEMWMVHDTPEYNRYSDELKRSVEALIKATEEQNLDSCALRFFDVTLKCMDCHEYLRRARL
jgi:hypothetical protein